MTPVRSGHVFVVHGDITTLAVDAWILPTDERAHIKSTNWKVYGSDLGERRAEFSLEFQDGRVYAQELPWVATSPGVPVATAVPVGGIYSVADLQPRLRAGLKAAALVASKKAQPTSRVLRVAMPTFGTSGGGGGHIVGAFLATYLELAQECASGYGVDVVIVCQNEASYHGLQILRCGATRDRWPALDGEKQWRAKELAREARTGQLTPFIGSGVSVTSGLPNWVDLLEALRLQQTDLTDVSKEEFDRLSTLDRADLLATVMGENLKDAIAEKALADRMGLPPLLLSALPIREAVTLNYDTLFEDARRAQGSPLIVIPNDRAKAGTTWLLKLHGSTNRRQDIVLTRQDYLAYASSRSALSSLATAMLMTRHLLFVGFGFSDDHFHRLLHDVQSVYASDGQVDTSGSRLGTALVLGHDAARERLWKNSVDIIAFTDGNSPTSQGRQLEIFLDMLTAHAVESPSYFLRAEYTGMLTKPEQRLAEVFRETVKAASHKGVRPSVREAFERLRVALGAPEA